MRIANVIVDVATQALDTAYSYIVPGFDEDVAVSPEGEQLSLFDDGDASGAGGGSGSLFGGYAGFDVPAGLCDPMGAAMGFEERAVQVGCAVLVPLGGRRAVGFVVSVEDRPRDDFDERMLKRMKPILRVLTDPYFDEEGAACAQWMADRYIAPLSSCIRLFTPPGAVPRMVRTSEGRWVVEQPAVGQVDDRWVAAGPALDDFRPKPNAVKQQAIIEAVRAGDMRVAELAAELGSVSGALKSLEKQGAVRIERRRRQRFVLPEGGPSTQEAPVRNADAGGGANQAPCGQRGQGALSLTAEQQHALDVIEGACGRGGEVVLVDGVTGSGKTEVYLRAIASVLAQGRSAIVLVPEISLTPQTVGRFRGRFGDQVAVMHSRMSQGERYDQWDFIRSGAARVVVGARSALFTPMANVGLIVIDEEHEGSYKQDSAPRYHARDVAVWMARRSGATVVLGSATPSIEALCACEADAGWQRVCLHERANRKPMPEVTVVDMAAEFSRGERSMFSRPLTVRLQRELAAGHKAVLLLNQRGFAKFLLCRDCGFVPECPSCASSLTYHEHGNRLVCHHCGYSVVSPGCCPSCASPYLKKFGAGTQRVEAELRMLLDGMEAVGPSVPVIRMDADTTARKGAHEALLARFAEPGAAVLLGTQMIAKGLDFSDVTLVGVVNADTQLHLPDYRAAERTFQLIEQVAGRAGRAELPGQVLVQTYEANSVPIVAAARYDRELFLADERVKRRMLGYPPFTRMANILVWGKVEDEVRNAAMELQREVGQAVFDYAGSDGGWVVMAATPCALSKLRNAYRWHIVVKCPAGQDLSAALLGLFRQRKPSRTVNVAVDVDPVSLL